MARSIPIEWIVDDDEVGLYSISLTNHSNPMSCGMMKGGARAFGQMMVQQTPRYDNGVRKRGRRPNQVIGKGGIIRPDKRHKIKYL